MGPRKAGRGFALILVLWVGALLTVVVATLAFGARSEVAITRGGVALAQAEALAEAGVMRAIAGLLERDRGARWRADGTDYSVSLESGTVTVRITSERGKVDLNAAPEELIRRLFAAAAARAGSGADETEIGAAEAALDWRDADGSARPRGAEAADYAAAGLPWVPANAPFATVSELRRVLGVTPALYGALAPDLTVNGVGARVDPQTASDRVLEAVPGAEPSQIETFLLEREEWAGAVGGDEGRRGSGGAFPSASLAGLERYLARGASAYYTVSASARTRDGRGAGRTALVRLTGRRASPAEIVAWDSAGVSAPTSAPAAAIESPD